MSDKLKLKKRQSRKLKSWLKHYGNLPSATTKKDLHNALRLYKTAYLNMRCVYSRYNATISKKEYQRKYLIAKKTAIRLSKK